MAKKRGKKGPGESGDTPEKTTQAQQSSHAAPVASQQDVQPVQQPPAQVAGVSGATEKPKQAGRGGGKPQVQEPVPGTSSGRSESTAPAGRGKPAQTKGAKAGATTLPELGKLTMGPPATMKPPKRPGLGGIGRRIILSANHFPVKISTGKLHHYDVEVKENVTAVLKRKIVREFMRTNRNVCNSRAVYDFKKNIYTLHLIQDDRNVPIGRTEFPFILRETDRAEAVERKFTVVLQPTGEVVIDLSVLDSYLKNGSSVDIPARAIQALEIAMKFGAASRADVVSIGSCLLNIPQQGRVVDLGQGAEVYFGHFQSLRLTWQKTLNIDASQRAFATAGHVLDVMAKTYDTKFGQPIRDFEDFSKKLRNLKVTYSRGNYMAKVGCNGLSKKSASEEKFECEGKMISVKDFFEAKLGKRLQYPNLPCLWVGSRDKKNYVPMEICSILPGQEYRRKLTDVQTTNMIRCAAIPADQRKRRIEEAVRNMNFDQDPIMNAFGIKVDKQMIKVEGRVLPAPALVYGPQERSTVTPRDGTWNMRGLQFVDARAIGKFGVLNLTRVNQQQIQAFMQALSKASTEMGMRFSSNNWAFNRNIDIRALENDMREAKKRVPDLSLLFVIISRKGDPAYEIVKKVGDLELKLVTQCVQFKNVVGRPGQGPDASTMANICLKLNAKMGGINNLIQRDVRPAVLKEQVIFLGADVTHPGADEGSDKPSVAAVVGSVDPRASQYCCEIRVQKSKQEYIQDMEGMVYNILRKYNRITGATSTGKPQRIIFFRDGVSEGQFAQVMIHEIAAIQKACLRLEPNYKPPITFIVVQKRHHTRLFPNDPRDEVGRSKNVPPGTVVDKDIVHPTEHDFYLVSHYGIQGTSRPTHYHVLWDDNKFSADEMQKLTYYLCHMFSRCTRSVSYPAPCYYAHLVAFRGRQYYDSINEKRTVSTPELQKMIDGSRDMEFMFFV